jgi:hypothetical protein
MPKLNLYQHAILLAAKKKVQVKTSMKILDILSIMFLKVVTHLNHLDTLKLNLSQLAIHLDVKRRQEPVKILLVMMDLED